ncbi:flagellar transcriptional regulator FlhC [Enterobacter bugandensis]|uniref:flagellar transcriptional regulator FlhC n=1 Tax=Enterobacter bugandensis TaxID=881260 RepID=UPI002867C530|nr:flagellar transcriptional regulator FlhC [Enterobacter bugandensis]
MSTKSVVQEGRDIKLAIELITLGARLQLLESETQLSRGRLVKLYKELRGKSPPKGMLPFSAEWFMSWEQNIHASMFCNAWQFLLRNDLCVGLDAFIKAYHLYLEQCPPAKLSHPLLAITRAWILVRFIQGGILELSPCKCCGGNFINYTHQPIGIFACSLCQTPSRALKKCDWRNQGEQD